MKAIITVGVSASGKSTFAREWVNEGYGQKSFTSPDEDFSVYVNSRVEINRDTIRQGLVEADGKVWSWSAWNWKREGEVSDIVTERIVAAFDAGKDIIVSDTNLNAKYRNAMVKMLESHGYKVEIKEFPVTWEEAVKRDNARANGVGITVLATQWKQWLEHIGRKTYARPNPKIGLLKCILVDVDGTLAHMGTKRKAFDWDKVGLDTVDEMVRAVVNSWAVQSLTTEDRRVIVLSGRDGVCRSETEQWLRNNSIVFDTLIMREPNDMRKDTIVKEEIFWRDIANNYDVQFVIDDRPSVCRMWRELGLKVFQVGDPHVEF
jgi:predicted kinase